MSVILGVNHQFLYPNAISDPKAHTETLKKLSENKNISALDCWIWRGKENEESKILLDSGKIINYNIGDRFGEKIALPASKDKCEQDRAYDLMMREISYALKVNSKKIIFGSGPDDPNDRQGAISRFKELILRVSKNLPKNVELSFEPTDRDIDKFFLFGPLSETVDFIKDLKNNGVNVGLLLDMCHVPLMYETLDSALEKGKEVLNHVHLGNCLLKDKSSPFYGDKHIPWSYPLSEYTEKDAVNFIKSLKDIDYLKDDATISFEMRPYDELSAEESLNRFVEVFKSAIAEGNRTHNAQ